MTYIGNHKTKSLKVINALDVKRITCTDNSWEVYTVDNQTVTKGKELPVTIRAYAMQSIHNTRWQVLVDLDKTTPCHRVQFAECGAKWELPLTIAIRYLVKRYPHYKAAINLEVKTVIADARQFRVFPTAIYQRQNGRKVTKRNGQRKAGLIPQVYPVGYPRIRPVTGTSKVVKKSTDNTK